MDSDKKNVIFKMCGVTVPASKDNMGNLFYYLKTKHVLEYEESQRMPSTKYRLRPQTQEGRKKFALLTNCRPLLSKLSLRALL